MDKKELALLREHYELLKKNLGSSEEAKVLILELEKQNSKLTELIKEVEIIGKNFPAKVEVLNQPEQKEFPKEIEVKNFPEQKEFPKSFEISNLEKIKIPEFPKKIETEDKGFIQTIKELGLIKTFLGKISEKINNFKQIDSVFIRNKTTDEAIPVKLADKDGKRFYNAIANAISAGVAPTDVSALATQITLADILTALQGTITVTGGGGGVEYTEDVAAAANPVGSVSILVRTDTPATQVSADGDNVAQRGTNYGAAYVQLVTSAGAYIDSVGGGTQYADGAVRGTATGTIAMGDDGTNIQSLKVDADGHPQVDVLTMPTVAVTGTFWQATQPVSATNLDIRDIDAATDDIKIQGIQGSNGGAGFNEILAYGAGDTDGNDSGLITNTHLQSWTGTVWARVRGDATDGLLVNLGTNNDVVVSATDLDIRNLTNVDVVTAELSAVDNAVLDVIAAKDFATQTTLAALNAKLVTGTVIGDVNLGATDNAVLDAIAASVTLLDNAISGSEMQVDVVAALPAGTNAIGKLLPSDVDVTTNTNHADKYYTNAGAVTYGIIWSPGAGKRWHITTLYLNVSAAATVTIEDDLAGGDVVRWKGELAANSGVILTYSAEHPFASGEDAADLIITTSAGNCYVQAVGFEI